MIKKAIPLFACILAILVYSGCKKPDPVVTPKPPVANAGTDQNLQLPLASFTLTGSATTPQGSITGSLWSLISGPNVPVINGPASATATVSNFIAGTYLFQYRATNSDGLTGLDTTRISVLPAPIVTLSLQPANNTTELHVIGGPSLDLADPNAPEFAASAWTINGDLAYYRGLVKFDLSSIPANATIISAKLSLYSTPNPLNGNHVDANFGSNNSMYIERISSSWTSATTKWSSLPATMTNDRVSIPHTAAKFLDLIDIDVKSMVSGMINTNTNFGFMIRLQNDVAYNSRIFSTSKHAQTAKRPKLVVVYQ
jgi:hypothetical protein